MIFLSKTILNSIAMNSTNMNNAPASSPAPAEPVLLEAKLADPDRLCCFVQNPNPCAAVQELFKIAAASDPKVRKLADAFLSGGIKAELVTNLPFTATAVAVEPVQKKRVRFSEAPPKKKMLDYDTKENLNPKEFLPNQEDDVSEFDAKFNKWSDDPKESQLYDINCQLNQIDPKVTDSGEYRKNMPAVPVALVEETRIRNWHAVSPKPLRFLMAVILTTDDIPGNLRKLSKQIVIKIKKMIDDLAIDLETGKKEFCHMYEYSVTINKAHLGRLKGRSKVIERYLQTQE